MSSYAYHKRWKHERAQGLTRTMPSDQVRLHIATLQGVGWSLRSIAGAADTSPSVLSRIARGEQPTVSKIIAAKVLAVRPNQVPSTPSKKTTEVFVPRIGTVRRIQALMFMGWGHRWMREHCGHSTAVLLHQQGRWVTRSTHDAIAAMYAELAMKPGPSSKARTYAAQRGYLSPMMWDDIDLDAEPEPEPVADEELAS